MMLHICHASIAFGALLRSVCLLLIWERKETADWFESCELTLVLVKFKLAFLVFVGVLGVHGKPWQEWEWSQWDDWFITETVECHQLCWWIIWQSNLCCCHGAARWRHWSVLNISLTIRQDDRLTFVSPLFIISPPPLFFFLLVKTPTVSVKRPNLNSQG